MEVIFHARLEKKLTRLPVKVQSKFYQRLRMFKLDAKSKILNNHPLKGKYLGYRSINITGDYRVIFKQEGKIFTFANIGTHSELYK